jgi:hypothetical protein
MKALTTKTLRRAFFFFDVSFAFTTSLFLDRAPSRSRCSHPTHIIVTRSCPSEENKTNWDVRVRA